MTNYSDFGLKVRVKLLETGKSLSSLASDIGISPAYLSDILKGSRKGLKYKKKISNLLDIC